VNYNILKLMMPATQQWDREWRKSF